MHRTPSQTIKFFIQGDQLFVPLAAEVRHIFKLSAILATARFEGGTGAGRIIRAQSAKK